MIHKLLLASAVAAVFAVPVSNVYADSDEKKPEQPQLIADSDEKKPEQPQLIADSDEKKPDQPQLG